MFDLVYFNNAGPLLRYGICDEYGDVPAEWTGGVYPQAEGFAVAFDVDTLVDDGTITPKTLRGMES